MRTSLSILKETWMLVYEAVQELTDVEDILQRINTDNHLSLGTDDSFSDDEVESDESKVNREMAVKISITGRRRANLN